MIKINIEFIKKQNTLSIKDMDVGYIAIGERNKLEYYFTIFKDSNEEIFYLLDLKTNSVICSSKNLKVLKGFMFNICNITKIKKSEDIILKIKE